MKTSFYTLLCIVVRVVALATLLSAVGNLPSQLVYLAAPDIGKIAAVAILGTQAANIVLCFVLWLFPGLLVNLAITRSAREPFESTIDAIDLQRVGFSIVGIWFTFEGVIAALYAYGRYAAVEYQYGVEANMPVPWLDLTVGIAMIVAGIALTLGSRGLARFLHTLRYGSPVQRPNEETP